MKSVRVRRALSGVMMGLCGLAVLVAFLPLLSVLWLVVSKGIAGLSWSFFTALPAPVGEPGGRAEFEERPELPCQRWRGCM